MKLYIKKIGESSLAVYEGEGPTSGSGQIYFQGRSLTCPLVEVWWKPASFGYGDKEINPFFCPRNIILSAPYVVHYYCGRTACDRMFRVW